MQEFTDAVAESFFWGEERRRRSSAPRPGTKPSMQEPAYSEAPQPLAIDQGKNPLRPTTFDGLIGQERTKALLRRVVDATKAKSVVLDHMLMVGRSGTGKTTLAVIVANELGTKVWQIAAPISFETLMALREVMKRGDILFIDEIHQQAIQERRGKQSSTQPEVLFNVMEDRTIATPMGILGFPEITIIGATTDEGMLPDPFINRFPLRPVLDPYTEVELTELAGYNAQAFAHPIELAAAKRFAKASRGIPRQINNYVRNATLLTGFAAVITDDLAREVIFELNRTTEDGLTVDMQAVLTFLFSKCGRRRADGEMVYTAGVGTLATAIGKSRDQKAIALRVEPFLIEQGYLQVGHGGRRLTDRGVERARKLLAIDGG